MARPAVGTNKVLPTLPDKPGQTLTLFPHFPRNTEKARHAFYRGGKNNFLFFLFFYCQGAQRTRKQTWILLASGALAVSPP